MVFRVSNPRFNKPKSQILLFLGDLSRWVITPAYRQAGSNHENHFKFLFKKEDNYPSFCPPGQRPLWVGDQREEKYFPLWKSLPAGRQGGLRGI